MAAIGLFGTAEVLAKRADRAVDRGTLGFLDASACHCRTRRAMTASGSSCRPLACSRSWSVLVPASCSSGSGPPGQAGHCRGLARRHRQHRRDDAGAALLLQPPGRWTTRSDRPGDGTDLLLGRSAPGARRWLFEHTEPPDTIQFATFPLSWLYLRDIGALPRRLTRIDRGPPKWYVLQNRPGAFCPHRSRPRHAWPPGVYGHQARHPSRSGSSLTAKSIA